MKIRSHRLLTLTMLSLLVAFALLAIPSIAQASDAPLLAPENQSFLDYLKNSSHVQVASEIPSGLIPEPFILPQPVSPTARVMATTLPASYDIRTLSKVTAVRNQGSCGSCWAFASIGSLESSLMPEANTNLSENNLKNLAGFDLTCCAGGNRTMSAAYLASWAGPLLETEDPYNPGSCASPQQIIPPAYHVQDIVYIPVRTSSLDNDAIKQAVMTYGAVYTTYYHSDTYYNSATAGYYYNGSSSANHAVCVVGWDDNFAASKFRTVPAGNGAWLIRNSWGSSWGSAGYFWMSYYDARMGKSENAAFIGSSATTYGNIYQYDELGWISNTGYGSTSAWFANVFTATASEPIGAASWYSAVPGSSYSIYIYTNPTSGPLSTSGAASTKTGVIDTAGYHTIALDTPVSVTAGQKFSVVVKLTTPGYTYPIPIERPYSGYSSAATASPGESYISSNGTSWSDLTSSSAKSNVCLKAFALGNSTPIPGTLSVTPSTTFSATGLQGGPFTPTAQTYTLTNTGNDTITWTASDTQSWLDLSSATGNLAPGASATLTATINSIANALAVGAYSATVSFVNATTGKGNTSRSITLNVTSSTPTPGALSVSPTTALSATGRVGGPFTPASQTYTLTNTGGNTISWSASKTQAWTTLSATSGTLAKGASTTVTASLAAATTLAAGSYSGTITFTNATNGTGNTTRQISLTVTSSSPTGTYKIMTEPYAWTAPFGYRLLLTDNSYSPGIILPFTFTFYGKPYTRLYVGSNGLIGFGSAGLTNSVNANIPSAAAPNAAIYPYWTDLNPSRGGYVYIGADGVSPNRRIVVSWVSMPLGTIALTTSFTFQAILYEQSNDIVFRYQNVTPTNMIYGGGSKATVGIENETGTLACKYSYNTYGAVKNGSAIRIGIR